MGKTTASLLAALLLAAVFCLSASAHSAEILPGGIGRYKAVRLTPAVYNGAAADLSDLLVKDGSGAAVPYFIRSRVVSESERREAYALEQTDSYRKDDRFYLDYRLADREESDSDTVATALEFAAPGKDFMEEVELWGSHDGVHWEFVQSDQLYMVDTAEKLAIAFDRPQRFTHYRLGLSESRERPSFDAVTLVYSVTTAEESYFIESISPAYRVAEVDRETKILIEGLKNLRLCDVTIHTDSMFQRMVRAEDGSGKELYHLVFGEASYEDLTLPLRREPPGGEEYTLTIANGDDAPIRVTGVTVRYYADEIVFEGAAGEAYTLEFDGSSGRPAPSYDIARYQDEILKGELDILTLGEIHYESAEPADEGADRSLLFNVVVIAVAILLAAILLLRLSRK